MATTILDIKTAIANYFELTVADLTVNGQDLALLALNQVRRQAELAHDFEFQRKLVTVSVDGVTGGSLGAAVLYSDGVTAVDVKSVVEVGVIDDDGNLRPVEWTTVAESIERQRKEERFTWNESLLLDDTLSTTNNARRFAVTGSRIFSFPKNTTADDVTLGLEVYAFTANWTGVGTAILIAGATNTDYNALYEYVGRIEGIISPVFWNEGPTNNQAIWRDSSSFVWWITTAANINRTLTNSFSRVGTSTETYPSNGAWTNHGTFTGTVTSTATLGDEATTDVWTTYATQYLQWGAIVQLNHLYKRFVFRQEGNLPPPEKLRDEGLEAFKTWDASRYENNRRHDR